VRFRICPIHVPHFHPSIATGAIQKHDDSGHWFRSYGNENWEFDNDGFMSRRIASINDPPIAESARKYFWSLGRRLTIIRACPIWVCKRRGKCRHTVACHLCRRAHGQPPEEIFVAKPMLKER
jgi:hypothetical protein